MVSMNKLKTGSCGHVILNTIWIKAPINRNIYNMIFLD